MSRGTGDRGVSEVVGFILVFGMLVAAFTVYQGVVVPDQNRRAEFEHNQEVQGDLQDLRNAIVSTAATGSGEAVSITLGADYPRRTIASNLGVSTGAISTGSAGALGIRIENARASNAETRDFLDTASNGPVGPIESHSIRYTPVYSFYSGAPETVYANTIAYNRFEDVNLTLTDQVVVDDRRITLIAVDGNLSRAQRDTVSVETEPISVSTNRVAIHNTSGGQVTLTLPTRLSASTWAEVLEDETGPNGYVESVVAAPGGDAVSIVLQQGVTYELRMAKVGVGPSTTEEPPAYLTDVEGDDVSVPEGGTQRLVVEVRDRFNNPVGNVTVDAGAPSQGSVSPAEDVSDSGGRASFVYEAPANVNGTQDVDVDVSFDGDGTDNESVSFDLRVLDADGSGGGGGDDGGDVDQVNPGASGTVILDTQSTISGNGNLSVTLTLRNTTGEPVSITGGRISFYFNGNPSGGDVAPTHVDVYSDEQGVPSSQSTRFDFGADFVSLSTDIPLDPTPSDSSDTTVVNLEFNQDIEDDDFYVVSLKFSNGDTYTYFVSHP